MNYTPPTKTPWDFGASLSVPFGLQGHYGRKVILWTTLLLTAMTMLALLLAWPMIMRAIPEIISLADNPESPEAVFGIIGIYMRFIGIFSIFGLLSLLILCSAEASVFAAYLRGDTKTGFPLRFDADMWRVLGARLLVGLCIGGAFIGVYIAALLLMVPMALMAESSTGGGAGIAVLGILAFLVVIAGFIAVIWIAVRLSTVAAVAVRDQQFDFGAGWRASKGRVWPMIGGFIIIAIILGIVQNIIMYGGGIGVLGASGIFSMGDEFSNVTSPAEGIEILTSLFNPLVIILAIIVTVLWTLVSTIGRLCMAGITAHAARLDTNASHIADTF